MAILHFVNLHCNTTEDDTGSDECELRIWIDTASYQRFRKDLNNTEDWYELQGLEFPFNERIKIQLWDRDLGHWPDPDDKLGELIIQPEPIAYTKGRFNKHGADYELEYSVVA